MLKQIVDCAYGWGRNRLSLLFTFVVGFGLVSLSARETVNVNVSTVNDTRPAAITRVGEFAGTVISPTAITGSVNDWAPTALSTATTILASTSGATTLTGLTGGVDGRRLDVCNTGTFTLTFTNDDAGSTAANRFFLPDGLSWSLGSTGHSCAQFVYDGTASRWRMNAKTGTSFPSLTDTGAWTLSGSIAPTALSGTTNNYAPTGFATAAVVLQDVSSAATITGLAGGVDGKIITFINISNNDARTLGFANESASSTAANRFTLPDATTWVVGSESGAATFRYNGSTSRWQLMQTINRALVANSLNIAAGTSLNGFFLDNATISPTALSGSTNNYTPANFATSFSIRQDVSSAATLTGLVAGVDGRLIVLTNIATVAADTLTLTNEDASSTAANRFTLPSAASWVIPAGGSTILKYDGTSARWRLADATTASAITGGTTNTIAKFTSSTAIGNSSVTDDGTTFAINSTELTVTEANGNTAIAGTLGVTGLTTTTGGFTDPGAMTLSGVIAPTAITGTNNDYAPTGFATASDISQDLSAAATLTGLAGGTAGRIITIHNIATATGRTLKFANESASSTAANRFINENGLNYEISAGGAATFQYDATASRWRSITSNNRTGVFTSLSTSGLTAAATTVSTLAASGHFTSTQVSGPTVLALSCGTGPTVDAASSDNAFRFTEGSAASGCTITFNGTFTSAPVCAPHSEAGLAFTFTTTATTLVIVNVGALSSTAFQVLCVGH